MTDNSKFINSMKEYINSLEDNKIYSMLVGILIKDIENIGIESSFRKSGLQIIKERTIYFPSKVYVKCRGNKESYLELLDLIPTICSMDLTNFSDMNKNIRNHINKLYDNDIYERIITLNLHNNINEEFIRDEIEKCQLDIQGKILTLCGKVYITCMGRKNNYLKLLSSELIISNIEQQQIFILT